MARADPRINPGRGRRSVDALPAMIVPTKPMAKDLIEQITGTRLALMAIEKKLHRPGCPACDISISEDGSQRNGRTRVYPERADRIAGMDGRSDLMPVPA